jgi:flavin-dependent dehydrogenase
MPLQPICVVGGGLAGLTLGVALRRSGVPVTLFEAGTYPRHRVCGEFLSGVGGHELTALGLDGVLARAVWHETTLWFAGETRVLSGRLPEPALAISRHVLDAALAKTFREAGGDLRCGERISVLPSGEGWINAAGRVRGSARWLGLKAHYRNLDLEAGLEMHLGQGGYAGLTQLENGVVNVCSLLPWRSGGGARSAALPTRLEEIGLRGLAARLEGAQIDDSTLTAVTHFGLGWQHKDHHAVSLGDRRVMIAPFTGNGMSMAIQGALITAPILRDWSQGRSTWRECQAESEAACRRRFASRTRWAQAVHALLLTRLGQTGLRALSATGLLPFAWLFRRLR